MHLLGPLELEPLPLLGPLGLEIGDATMIGLRGLNGPPSSTVGRCVRSFVGLGVTSLVSVAGALEGIALSV